MSSVTPLVVTHPSALFRDGIRKILSKSPFRPVHILPALNEETESYLASAGCCIWLVGVNECGPAANDLVRKVVATNPGLRVVILTASHTVDDILPAFVAGACGFLRQDITSKQLIKSLELIALGESVMHPHFQQMALTSPAGPSIETGGVAAQRELSEEGNGKTSIQLFSPRLPDFRSVTAVDLSLPANEQSMPGNDVIRSLSRRELVILRTLTEGASNKIIARKLVITESTVKVHMKAILRKLRLQNRTQAAIWARTHLGEVLGTAA
jgi:two-component system, NarL family, nitrate/nitrite response regulator NarL